MGSPLGIFEGIRCFVSGTKWLTARPLLLVLLYVPMILGLALIVAGLGALANNFDAWMSFILFEKPETTWGILGYWFSYASAALGSLLVVLLSGFLLPSIIASPFYDYVSMKVESSVTGKKAVEISIMRSLLLVVEEIKKVVFILIVSLVALFVPLLNLLVPAWMLAWEFYDYPLSRRGYSFKERLRIVFGDFWGVAGMSVWFLIPFIQFLLMPLAVAGGTMLAVKSLDK